MSRARKMMCNARSGSKIWLPTPTSENRSSGSGQGGCTVLTGQHEQLWAVDGAGGHHDLAAGQRCPLQTVTLEFHTVRALAVRVDEHPGDVRP